MGPQLRVPLGTDWPERASPGRQGPTGSAPPAPTSARPELSWDGSQGLEATRHPQPPSPAQASWPSPPCIQPGPGGTCSGGEFSQMGGRALGPSSGERGLRVHPLAMPADTVPGSGWSDLALPPTPGPRQVPLPPLGTAVTESLRPSFFTPQTTTVRPPLPPAEESFPCLHRVHKPGNQAARQAAHSLLQAQGELDLGGPPGSRLSTWPHGHVPGTPRRTEPGCACVSPSPLPGWSRPRGAHVHSGASQ